MYAQFVNMMICLSNHITKMGLALMKSAHAVDFNLGMTIIPIKVRLI